MCLFAGLIIGIHYPVFVNNFDKTIEGGHLRELKKLINNSLSGGCHAG